MEGHCKNIPPKLKWIKLKKTKFITNFSLTDAFEIIWTYMSFELIYSYLN